MAGATGGRFCTKCGAWLGNWGNEPTPEKYVENCVEFFGKVRENLREDGVFVLNLGDTYYRGSLCGIPWRVAFALQEDGWFLRSAVVWAKGFSFCETYHGSVMPENPVCTSWVWKGGRLRLRSGRWRPTKAHEFAFIFSASETSYYTDFGATRESGVFPAGTLGGKGSVVRQASGANARPPSYARYSGTRNLRDVWWLDPRAIWPQGDLLTLRLKPSHFPHFATFPVEFPLRFIDLFAPKRCCPVCGKGWVSMVEGSKTICSLPSCDCYGNLGGDDPKELEKRCKEKLPPKPGLVYDPCVGSGTTCFAAAYRGLRWVGCDLSESYLSEFAVPRLTGF